MKLVRGPLLFLLFVLGYAAACYAEMDPGSGVEVVNAKRLEYVVEELSEDGRRLGITKEQIRRKIEQRLREAGITPVDGETAGTTDPFVYVRVAIGGQGFNIRVEFSRLVSYEVNGRLLKTFGVMWSNSITGYSADANVVMTSIDRPVGRFVDEFLKVNN